MYDNSQSESVLKDFVCGGTAAMINICVIFPFYKTVFFQQLDNMSITEAYIRLFKEGRSNLYRGLLPPLIQTALTRSIMFGGYGKSLSMLDEANVIPFESLRIGLSGFSAGLMEACLMPLERVQVLLQNQVYNKEYRHTVQSFRSLRQIYGYRELYRGFWTVLLRNCSANAVYFSVCHRLISRLSAPALASDSPSTTSIVYEQESSPPMVSFLPSHLYNFLVGGGLGAAIGLLIYPLNVAKTRQQSQVGGSFRRAWSCLCDIHRERGRSIGQIYRGAPANCLRSIVSWGLLTMLNEGLRNSKPIQQMFV